MEFASYYGSRFGSLTHTATTTEVHPPRYQDFRGKMVPITCAYLTDGATVHAGESESTSY